VLGVIRELLLHIGVCAAYLCVAIIGLRTDSTNHTEPLVWLPIGFALGTFLIGGLRFLPALLAASWLAYSWLSVIPVGGGLLAAATSSTVPALVAWFLRRVIGFDPTLDRVADLAWVLVVAIPITCALDALGVTTAFRLVAQREIDAAALWAHWILAECVGATILTPAMLLAFSVPMGSLKPGRWGELLVLVALLTLASMLAIYKPDLTFVGPLAAVAALPIGVTIAIRFDRLGAAVIGLVSASVLLSAAVTGDGPFNPDLVEEASRRALGLWGVALALQTMAVLLGVSVASNRRNTAEVASVAGRLRLVVDAAKLGYWQIDLGLRTTHANDRLEAMLGAVHGSLRGRSIFDIALPAHRESLQRAIDRTLAGQPCDIEVECVRGDASTAWLGLHLSAFVDERGARRGVIAAVEDLADRRRAESERLRLETNVLQAQRLESLGVLSGGIAHDFNNIVMGIRGNAGLLRLREGDGDGVREAAERIDAACERAAGLVSTLLAYAGRGPFSPERVSVARVLRDALGIVSTSAPRSAKIDLGPVSANLEVDADPQHLRQMLVSILTNALEALPPSGGCVRVAADEEHGHAVMRVTDDGAGMDHQTISRAFEPFFTTKGVGRGLGLSASLGIAQRLGGSIELDSAVGRGTTVTIKLPIAVRDQVTAPRTLAAGDDAPQRATAIVAESDPAVRDLVLAALQVRGYVVAEQRSLRGSLREALRATVRPPTLIVASSGASVIEALEEIRVARASGCSVPVVLTTQRHETIVLHPQDPRTVWLAQPFGVRAFLDAVDTAQNAVEVGR
jgi:PAS domain S-box-containing protein